MEITLFSRHVPKTATDSRTILNDIRTFQKAVHTAFVLDQRDREFGKTRKEQGLPDRRTKEGKDAAAKEPPSVFLRLKEKYGFNTYFANSASQQAAAVLRSVKELHAANVKEVKRQLSEVKGKLAKTKKRLVQLEKTKSDLIAISRYEKNPCGKRPKLRMPVGGIETFDKETGAFTVRRYDKKASVREVRDTFADAYQFETRYLDPKIKRLRHRCSMLENRIRHLNAKVSSMKELPGVCFGSKSLFRKQDTVYAEDHNVWLHAFRKARNRGMTISGRSDSRDGNYVFRYDPDTHTLFYSAMNGETITIPHVEFPYGQDRLDAYVRQQKEKKSSPIAWRIEESGGSFLIKCTLHLPEPKYKNHAYDSGCIGMDMNADCFALCETDGSGNLLHHWIVPFALEGKTSAQAEHILSAALEEVFRICREAKKPLAMEELSDVASSNTDMYGSRKRNRKVSSFAHAKMTALAMSKSNKYQIAVRKVNPAFTSQIGKVKYMSRYGLSVHESAAMVIARRAMGMKDRLPKKYRGRLPEKKAAKHHWAHWRHFMAEIKEAGTSSFYRRVSMPRSPCAAADLPF